MLEREKGLRVIFHFIAMLRVSDLVHLLLQLFYVLFSGSNKRETVTSKTIPKRPFDTTLRDK